MKPTTEDFQPRRDGWFEHKGTWDEVHVGTVIASHKRSERWEIIDQQMGPAPGPEHGRTLWMRAREQTSGAEYTVEPRQKWTSVTILTQNPADRSTGEAAPPSDAEAIMLLVKELGAEVLASRDEGTGEITCPDYVYRSHIPGYGERQISRGLVEHIRFAHQHPCDDDLDIASLTTLHGQCHNPKWPNIGKGGFPHRHVPEDLTIYTGIR